MKALPVIIASLLALTVFLSAQEPPKSPTPATPTASALIIFDASGSMWGQIKGRAKIEIAREVVGDLVKSLPAETELGLMAYGHRRKGDCDDIELLIPVGPVDREAFVKTVNAIMPVGMTPITASLELAAEQLKYLEQKATVILVSDGLETCDADPCEAAKKLEALGVDFTAHVIAFDLKPEEGEQLRCIAESTGGHFFPASDAASLKDALDQAVESMEEAPAPPPADRTANLTAPDTAVAGSDVEVSWDVEQEPGDYITIAKAGAKDSEYFGYAYTKDKTSAAVTTLVDPGMAELRYVSGPDRKVIARRPIELTEFEITLVAPDEVVAGSQVDIEWTGPDYAGDFITIVSSDTKDGSYDRWEYTKKGNPLKVGAPIQPGAAEIRYMSGNGSRVLARKPIAIVKGEVTLTSEPEVVAGSKVRVEWTGPNNERDFITIVPKDTPDGKYADYSYTKEGSPMEIASPYEVGDAEIRYMSGHGSKVLARVPLTIVAAGYTLKAAEEVVQGSKVTVEWTGPNNERDFITIVSKDTPDGKYADYSYTKEGSPMEIAAPNEVGEAEIRYMSGRGSKVMAREPIRIVAASYTLAAEDEVVAGSKVTVEWTGPNNERDFITIVPKDTPDGKYADYSYTKEGSPMEIAAPYEMGEAEIRYMSGRGSKVMAREPIRIVAASYTLEAEDEVVAGSKVTVEWTGPNNERDFITIVSKNTPDGKYADYSYTREGSPLEIAAPFAAGDAEIRYMSGRGSKVMAREPLKLIAPEISLKAAERGIAGEDISIEWTGPNHAGDFITIVPKAAKDGKYESYAYTKDGSPAVVSATTTPGDAEIRYMNERGNIVLARIPFVVIESEKDN